MRPDYRAHFDWVLQQRRRNGEPMDGEDFERDVLIPTDDDGCDVRHVLTSTQRHAVYVARDPRMRRDCLRLLASVHRRTT